MAALNEVTFTPESQTGSDVHQTNKVAPSFLIAFSDGNKAVYQASIDGLSLGSFTSNALGETTITTTALVDGTHTLTVHETAPHDQDLTPFVFVVDTVAPPAIPAVTLASFSKDPANPQPDVTPYPSPALMGTGAQAGAAIILRMNGSTGYGGGVASATGTYTVRPTPLANGVYRITVTQLDKAGNESVQSPVFALTVAAPVVADTTAPTVTPISKTTTTSVMTQLRWSGTDNAGGSGIDHYNVYRDGAFFASVQFPATADVTGTTASTYQVEAVDRAGNVSARVAIS